MKMPANGGGASPAASNPSEGQILLSRYFHIGITGGSHSKPCLSFPLRFLSPVFVLSYRNHNKAFEKISPREKLFSRKIRRPLICNLVSRLSLDCQLQRFQVFFFDFPSDFLGKQTKG